MKNQFELDPALLEGLDAYRAQHSDGPEKIKRADAINIIVRDWLQGQGFMAIPGERKHTTARNAASVPSGYLDP